MRITQTEPESNFLRDYKFSMANMTEHVIVDSGAFIRNAPVKVGCNIQQRYWELLQKP